MMVTTMSGGEIELQNCVLEGLNMRLRGPVIASGHAGYEDSCAVWNAMIDRRPAAVLGFVSLTGCAGLTLDGSFGYLTRRYGRTSDTVVIMHMVTVQVELLRASSDENADLFWGLRGGGGNFGAVTGIEYTIYPVGPKIVVGLVAWLASQAPKVFGLCGRSHQVVRQAGRRRARSPHLYPAAVDARPHPAQGAALLLEERVSARDRTWVMREGHRARGRRHRTRRMGARALGRHESILDRRHVYQPPDGRRRRGASGRRTRQGALASRRDLERMGSRQRLSHQTQHRARLNQPPPRNPFYAEAGGSPGNRRSGSSETPGGSPALGHAHLPDETLLQRALALEKRAQVVGRGIVKGLELVLAEGAQLLVGHDASSEGLRAGRGRLTFLMLDRTGELQEPGHASEISELPTARVKKPDTPGAPFPARAGKGESIQRLTRGPSGKTG